MENSNQINSTIKLQTNDEAQVLELSEFELFDKSSFKCKLIVWSRGFGFKNDVFFDNFSPFIEALQKMESSLKGEAELRENNHDHFLKFRIAKLGHLYISGHLIEYSEFGQNLEFEFKTDQTCLKPFIRELKQVFTTGS